MLDQLAQREFPARPIIVATGFSTCLLGDERTLREFVIGDQVRQALSNAGHNVLLYLINDTYDPLDYRQLRVGVNKDPGLIERYAPFCGMPIAEIPDPFGCHSSYADHFADAWMARLRSLDIHPVLIDSRRAYNRGHYATYIHQVLEQYAEIQESVAHTPIAAAYGAPNPKLKNVGDSFAEGEYVIAFRRNDVALRNAVDSALHQIKTDGTFQQILEKWGLFDQHQQRIVNIDSASN